MAILRRWPAGGVRRPNGLRLCVRIPLEGKAKEARAVKIDEPAKIEPVTKEERSAKFENSAVLLFESRRRPSPRMDASS